MLKKVLLNLSFICSFVVSAQSISKQVIGATGKTQFNTNILASYTVGEPIVGLMTAGGNQLGNGYWPSLNLQSLNINDNSIELELCLYPNPTSESLIVSYPIMITLGISIVDINGKLIHHGTINVEQPLDISKYSQGIYIVTIENFESRKKNIYKIIKK